MVTTGYTIYANINMNGPKLDKYVYFFTCVEIQVRKVLSGKVIYYLTCIIVYQLAFRTQSKSA